MKPIFNSLGSNYSFSFAIKAFREMFKFKSNLTEQKYLAELSDYLSNIYEGKSYLFYKGRDAIEFALRVLFEEKKSKVLTQGFSCYAIEEGISRAGMIPVYVDIGDKSSNMTVDSIEKSFEKNKDAKAVFVQHSLGIPADILAIRKWCDKNNLFLIEDLAQAIGGVDSNGEKLGKFSDVVIFSFGRDKIIDAISGGAVVFKKLTEQQKQLIDALQLNKVANISKEIFVKDMLYPLITFLGRNTHQLYLGKVILKLAKNLKLITSPTISPTNKMTRMNSSYAMLALDVIKNIDEQLLNRKKISKYFFGNISNENVEIVNTKESIKEGSNLRFLIKTKKVNELIEYFKINDIYLSDRWYRSAVDCGTFNCKTVYEKGMLKNAENLSEVVVNLPTHKNISMDDASRIVDVLNKY